MLKRIFGKVNDRVEAAVGASKLDSYQRSQLLAEQIHSLTVMTPVSAIGCVVIISIILTNGYSDQPIWLPLAWAFGLLALQGYSLSKWFHVRRSQRLKTAPLRFMRKICMNASLAGGLWGLLPLFSISHADNDLMMIAIIAVAGGTTFVLAALPQAVLMFLTPMGLGVILASLVTPTSSISTAGFGIFASFFVFLPFMAIRFSSNFVQHVITEITMGEQKHVIDLLLREYEENSSDWVWECDAEGRIQRPSSHFQKSINLPAEELEGNHLLEIFLSHSDDKVTIEKLAGLMDKKMRFRDLKIRFNLNGKETWWRLAGKPNYDQTEKYIGYIGIGANITAEKLAENKIKKLAHADSLTGLLNRTRFTEEMDAAIADLERYGTNFALLFLDLDNFKLVNDMRGHLVGDKLLKEVSQRILDTVRSTDMVARLGGDEFAIIMRDDSDAGAAAKLAAKLLNVVSNRYEIEGEHHHIGVSIGIALAPINGTRPNQLLRNADLALYRSKSDGRGVFRFFEAQMDADQREKRLLEHELREAIDKDEFHLYFQPLVSTTTRLATAMEALIRWDHPIRGLVSPAEFIPIAEKSYIIQEIGKWTLRQACRNAANWPKDIVVAVNVSPQHFIGSDIVSATQAALEEFNFDAHRLEIEVTESLLINNTDEVLKTLLALKELGVAIVLDDFGTGYSSLSYIMKFPFDKIKIDRSFVKASDNDLAAREILRMISDLGEKLGIRITAEGVETQEQIDFLKNIKCDQFQGYYFAKPLPEADVASFFLSQTGLLEESAPEDENTISGKVA